MNKRQKKKLANRVLKETMKMRRKYDHTNAVGYSVEFTGFNRCHIVICMIRHGWFFIPSKGQEKSYDRYRNLWRKYCK